MTKSKLAQSGWVAAVCGAAIMFAFSAARADETATFEKLHSSYSPSIVTIKFVLKVKSSMGEQENESEATGAMIDAKGLVLCSNSQIGGFSAAVKKMLARRGGDVSATPTDIKVMVGDDVEGVEGKVVARDSDLDLAWVQIKTPPAKPYAFIDFSKATNVRAGDRIYCLRRLDKYYDRSIVISEGWVAGTTKKPRDLFVPGGTIASAVGLPVYLHGGEPIGVIITQMAEDDEDMRNMQRTSGAFVLPAGEVVRATQRAKESAASGKGEESEEADSDSKDSKEEKKPSKSDDDDDAPKKSGDKKGAKAADDKKSDAGKDD